MSSILHLFFYSLFLPDNLSPYTFTFNTKGKCIESINVDRHSFRPEILTNFKYELKVFIENNKIVFLHKKKENQIIVDIARTNYSLCCVKHA